MNLDICLPKLFLEEVIVHYIYNDIHGFKHPGRGLAALNLINVMGVVRQFDNAMASNHCGVETVIVTGVVINTGGRVQFRPVDITQVHPILGTNLGNLGVKLGYQGVERLVHGGLRDRLKTVED